MNRVLSLLMLAVLVGTSVNARAADAPEAKAPPAMAPSAPAEPGAAYPDSVTAHSVAVGVEPDAVAAITREAHRQGILVWAHAAVFPASPAEVVKGFSTRT